MTVLGMFTFVGPQNHETQSTTGIFAETEIAICDVGRNVGDKRRR